jgi:hypothetical protein
LFYAYSSSSYAVSPPLHFSVPFLISISHLRIYPFRWFSLLNSVTLFLPSHFSFHSFFSYSSIYLPTSMSPEATAYALQPNNVYGLNAEAWNSSLWYL